MPRVEAVGPLWHQWGDRSPLLPGGEPEQPKGLARPSLLILAWAQSHRKPEM